jgi:hypothetical protein
MLFPAMRGAPAALEKACSARRRTCGFASGDGRWVECRFIEVQSNRAVLRRPFKSRFREYEVYPSVNKRYRPVMKLYS